MAFSATDAALEGFRIARQQPKAMLIWALASLTLSVVSAVVMITLFGGALNQMMTMEQGSDPQAAMAMLGQMGLLYLVLIPLGVLIFAVFSAAVYRAVLRPADSAFGYLRFGADELRLAVVIFVVGLLTILISFIVMFVVALIAGIVGFGMMGGASSGGGGFLFTVMLAILLYFFALVVMLAFLTKLSFAGPMTFTEKRIRIFESWKATKGRFWPLFGCYLMAIILGLVVSLLGGVISFAVMSAFGGPALGAGGIIGMAEAMEPDFQSLATYFTPAIIANLVISSFFSALTYAIFLAPAAVAYREITGRTGPGVSDTFG